MLNYDIRTAPGPPFADQAHRQAGVQGAAYDIRLAGFTCSRRSKGYAANASPKAQLSTVEDINAAGGQVIFHHQCAGRSGIELFRRLVEECERGMMSRYLTSPRHWCSAAAVVFLMA